MTLFFANDYGRGAHPLILQRLAQTNMATQVGYGADEYSQEAVDKIKQACDKPDAEVFLLVGGTQTNKIVIHSLLQFNQAVVSADTGHIHTMEAGAIEASGHKIIALSSQDGKLTSQQLTECFQQYQNPRLQMHTVTPGLVYLSQPTELGTVYTQAELTEIYRICQDNDVLLFIDGARLGYGLMSDACDMDLNTLANLCDVFYIGGTKVGALCGEAIVFSKPQCMPKNYRAIIKQQGALLAKGRLLGVQFATLFTDNLYFELGQHAIDMAQRLKAGLEAKNYRFFVDSPTNQQFVIMSHTQLATLAETVAFGEWQDYDAAHRVIRLVTDWSTTKEDVDALLAQL